MSSSLSFDALAIPDLLASSQAIPVHDLHDDAPQVPGTSSTAAEDAMSEDQLRELYDNEEIERFLHLFSTYVTEVRLPEPPSNPNEKLKPQFHDPQAGTPTDYDNDTIMIDANQTAGLTYPVVDRPFAEDIALRYIVPSLPPVRRPAPAFTLGRLRLTVQRLYLAVQPAYVPFFTHLVKLATWQDKTISSKYCAIFWLLWYHNLLLPYLFLRIFYSLIRRKIFPYPTLEELLEHRRQVARADEFGDQVSARLSASSFGVKEIWRIVKVFNKTTKSKTKGASKVKTKETSLSMSLGDTDTDGKSDLDDATVLDNSEDSQEAKDLKRQGLYILSELADLHERIKNIFIWRRPASSRVYSLALILMFLITLFLPAKYIAKLIYFLGGFAFWHITPVIIALPASECDRLPPAFSDAPTDAEYAMELIARRIAAGLDVTPTRTKKSQKYSSENTIDTGTGTLPQQKERNDELRSRSEDRSVDWKKWGERAALGKSWAEDGRRFVSGNQNPNAWSTGSTSIPPASAISRPGESLEHHTYPAQHSKAPGLLTVTPTTLFFTPLMSMNPKVIIPLNDIRGVKKTGVLKGLSVRSTQTLGSGEKTEREDKFMWVGSRDELFARLIGSDGKRWLNV